MDKISVILLGCCIATALAACLPAGSNQDTINQLFTNGGPNTVVSLCPNTVYLLNGTIVFQAPAQELSTEGYPTDASRAILQIDASNDTTLCTAISAGNGGLDSIKIRNLQVNGNRPQFGLYSGGANIEVGGSNTGQVVDHVTSYEPRGWSCLHIAEGNLDCSGAIITNNQIGPSGHSNGTWADGISLSCSNSLVENNYITDATDGGIVIFGSPGSTVRNNVITSLTRVQLGGINLVDYNPWGGNYNGLLVYNNTIDAKGVQTKVAMACGTAVWFNTNSNYNRGATVLNNTITGAYMGYGIALSNVANWTVKGNIFTATYSGDTSNCPNGNISPTSLLYDPSTTSNCTLQSGFVTGKADFAICIQPGLSETVTYAAGDQILSLSSGGKIQLNSSYLQLQDNCNLVLRKNDGTPLWASGTVGYSGHCKLNYGSNGILSIVEDGQVLYSLPPNTTENYGGSFVISTGPPYIAAYDNTSSLFWGVVFYVPKFELHWPNYLRQNYEGVEYYLSISSDAHAQVTKGSLDGQVLWQSKNFYSGAVCNATVACFLVVQLSDGNFVLYSGGNAPWAGGGGKGGGVGLVFNPYEPYYEIKDSAFNTVNTDTSSCSVTSDCAAGLYCAVNGYCGSAAYNASFTTNAAVPAFTTALTSTTSSTTASTSATSPLTTAQGSTTVSPSSESTNSITTTSTGDLKGAAAKMMLSFAVILFVALSL